MKRWYILGVLVLVVFAACATMGGSKFADSMYESSIDDFSGYQDWKKVNDETITGDETGFLGPAHAGAEGFREVYINKAGEAVDTGKKDFPYPLGTIIVKESYPEKGMLGALTIMIKRGDDYDPANGNWEYMMVSPENEVAAQGKVEMCIGCHANAEDTDWVFGNNRGMM